MEQMALKGEGSQKKLTLQTFVQEENPRASAWEHGLGILRVPGTQSVLRKVSWG